MNMEAYCKGNGDLRDRGTTTQSDKKFQTAIDTL